MKRKFVFILCFLMSRPAFAKREDEAWYFYQGFGIHFGFYQDSVKQGFDSVDNENMSLYVFGRAMFEPVGIYFKILPGIALGAVPQFLLSSESVISPHTGFHTFSGY